MKKIIAVILALTMVFSVSSVAVFAVETSETTTVVEETTTSIMNDDGLVVPNNGNQLKFAVIFKLIEKVVKFIMGLFGQDGSAEEAINNYINDAADTINSLVKDIFG